MTDEELDALAERCRRELDALPYCEGTLTRDGAIARHLREAYDAGVKAARPQPPGDAPVLEGRLDEIREMVTHAWAALGTDPAVERDGRDLLAAFDFERKRADHCESAMADLLAESDRYAVGEAAGVARALAAVREVLLEEQDGGEARAALLTAVGAIKGRCGPAATPLPYLASLARMRRLEAAAARAADALRRSNMHAAVLDAERILRETLEGPEARG